MNDDTTPSPTICDCGATFPTFADYRAHFAARPAREYRFHNVDEACPTPASIAAGCGCKACERAGVYR